MKGHGFVHLNVHTNYSLLSGASRVAEILAGAKALGFDALAITDTNGLYGAIPFIQKARDLGIKPILGAEVEHDSQRAVCLARDREGYANLCRLITGRQLDEKFVLAESIVTHQDGLFILTHSPGLLRGLRGKIKKGRLFRELQRLPGSRSEDTEEFGDIPPVTTNNVHFVSPAQHRIHRILTAVRLNKLLSEVKPHETIHPEAWLKGADEMARSFMNDATGRRAMANTRWIAGRCNLELQTGKPIFPRFFNLEDVREKFPGETPYSALCKLAFEGVRERYRPILPEVMKRLEYELDVINRLGFSEYFLIVWDIVQFAHRKGIPIVGRGSAANSLVAYVLGITSVDPLRYKLYFERFLNLSRSDCPDIDMDLCWRRRDEVLQYVYDRYGEDCVAMVSNHNTYQARSAFRDVARVMGLPMEEINRLSKTLPYYGARSIREAIKLFPEAHGFPIDQEPYRTIVKRAEAIDGFPRHLSIHAGGIVIGDRELTNYVPLERATKGLIITQYEMHAAETIGLVKIDLLGHRTLTVISNTIDVIEKGSGIKIAPAEIPDGDEKTAAVLREGRTIGCFQIESPGMRSLLQMIRAEKRLDVIHALSLIRPGPSGSGMKERFVRRRLGEEQTAYLDPCLENVLGETHGVMLYQEDILKVAEAVAGFTLEEGDELRKAISKKRSPERIASLCQRFMKGAVRRGVKRTAAEEIWGLIQNFAGYSYCKSHAVTYGHISYQATYLKAHYPAEFLASMMSNSAGFYEPREYLEEARRLGVKVLGPDVNRSAIFHIGRRGSIRIGLGQVKGLSRRAMRSIIRARGQRPFASLEDFYFRTQVNDSETEKLILCGALDDFGKTRPELLWQHRLLSQEVRKSGGSVLGGKLLGVAEGDAGVYEATHRAPPELVQDFRNPARVSEIPDAVRRLADLEGRGRPSKGLQRRNATNRSVSERQLARHSPATDDGARGEAPVEVQLFANSSRICEKLDLPEYPLEKRIELEQEILDMAISDHPLRMFAKELSGRRFVISNQLHRHVGRRVTVAGWLVTMRRAVTTKREYMKFVTLEDRFGTMEVILFPETYRRFGHVLRSYGPYIVRGKVEQNHRALGITADWITDALRL